MPVIKELMIKEGEWIDFMLENEEYEYPKCEMKLSFTQEYLHIKAVVHDLHFKDGDRSWRYGDGFFFNFITQTNEDNKPSEKFYAYGFSVMAGKRCSTLVNHNGVYFLRLEKSFPPEIEIDETSNKAFYDIKLPWNKLKPFHPLLDEVLGINIRYNSQNDDETTRRLQLVKDQEFDSELVVEKYYLPVYLHQSDKSEIQFAFELESNLILENEVNSHTVIYSPEKKKTSLRILMKDEKEAVIDEIYNEIELDKGINHIHQELEFFNITASYSVDVFMDELESHNHKILRFNTDDLNSLESRIISFEKTANTPLSESSLYSLKYKIEVLKASINNFDPKESTELIQKEYEHISEMIELYERDGHFYNEPGYYLAAFKSKDDQTLQPYSIVFPEKPDPSKETKLLVALHGSGVDEIGFSKFIAQNVKELGLHYIVLAPRGRGLSDWYVGQTERDVFEIIDTVKKMFMIGKTIIYGFSMGGYGVWRITFLYPDSFDTAIIGSGSPCNPWKEEPEMDVRSLRGNAKHINYLVMHGDEDRAVAFGPVAEFIDVLKEEGFNITFEVFKGAGHGNYDPGEILTNWFEKYG